jgi:hypothetical protein
LTTDGSGASLVTTVVVSAAWTVWVKSALAEPLKLALSEV